MKKCVALILALLMALSFVACGGSASQPETSSVPSASPSEPADTGTDSEDNKPYKIAMIAPFTGDSAQYGNSLKNALSYHLDQVNAEGGINGHLIEVDYYDDANDATQSTSLAQQVADNDEYLACFGPWSSTCALAAAPILNDAGILMIAPSSSHADLTSVGEYIVRGTLTNPIQMKFVAQFIRDELKADKAAIIYQNNDVGNAYNDLFYQDYQEALGGEIVLSETYMAGETNFNAILTKVKESGAQVLQVYGGYSDCATLMQQAQNLDLDCQLVFWGTCYTTPFIELVGESGDGLILMTSFDANNPSEALQEFRKAYIEKYGIDLDLHSAHTYDIARVFTARLAELGPDREALAKAMRNFENEESLSGVFNMYDGDTEKPMSVITIENGEFIAYGKVHPEYKGLTIRY